MGMGCQRDVEVKGSSQGLGEGVRDCWGWSCRVSSPVWELLSSCGCWIWCSKGKEHPWSPAPAGRLTLAFPLSPQMAGMSPGRHLVPAEASCRAEDRLLWLLLGPEHQPQVPAGAADCGGYLGEGWSLADRQGRWFQSLPGWQQIHGATLLLSIPMAGARPFHPWPDLGVWLLLA